MTPSKKRTSSGLNELETQLYSDLMNLKAAADDGLDGDLNQDEPATEGQGFKQRIDAMIRLLVSKMVPKSLGFSGVTSDDLTKLHISSTGHIALKHGSECLPRISETTSLGQDELWSSKNLYRQLQVLSTLIPRTTEASSRAWIDAFVFRVSAMLPSNRRMVLNMEHNIPPTATGSSSLSSLSGFIDYTAVIASPDVAAVILTSPHIRDLKTRIISSFFVIEAKNLASSSCVPQAICEMYASAKSLRKKVIRGALTDGVQWIFLILRINTNFDGGTYNQSAPVKLHSVESLEGQLPEILTPWPDLIAGILLYWIEHSFEDIGNEDWFKLVA